MAPAPHPPQFPRLSVGRMPWQGAGGRFPRYGKQEAAESSAASVATTAVHVPFSATALSIPVPSTRFLRAFRQAVTGITATIVISLSLRSTPLTAAPSVLLWDANSGTSGAQDGSGTWATSTGNWRNTGTSTDNRTFANGDTVTFG